MDSKTLRESAENIKPWLVEVRRNFHKYPELSGKEFKTSEAVINYFNEMKIPCQRIGSGTAVVGFINGGEDGKTVALRADMDALPIQEENDVSYRSQNDGIMHACGHDAHMTVLLGAAKILNAHRDAVKGKVKLLFQPSEESDGGAAQMIRDGCLENPHVDYCLGLHVQPYLPVGKVEVKYGVLNAASDRFEITIKGKRAHGAYPELGTDAILISAHVITALQSIISRSVAPTDSAVLTIGKISGGIRENIIADEVKLGATLRTLNQSIRELVHRKVNEIVCGISAAMGGSAEIKVIRGYDALVNNDEIVDVVRSAASSVLQSENVLTKEKPSLGSEDFSFFLNRCKGAFYHLGCGNEKKGIVSPLHTSTFNIDEDCLPVGAALQVAAALALLCNQN